jgi:putative tributyrin esterase
MAHLSINFKSEALGMPVVMDAIIPQGHGEYKSLYLLHGAGGGHESWLSKTRIADYVENTDIAVFMPSGNNKFYVNNVNGKAYSTFITKEIVDKCENWFNISRKSEDRFIAGMSMGGYGAIYSALNNMDRYRAAFSYSGLLNILERYDNPQGLDLFVPFGTRQELTDNKLDLFGIISEMSGAKCGNESGKMCKTSSNGVTAYVDKSVDNVDNFCEFVIECGLSDSRINMSRDFVKASQNASLKVIYREEDGKHNFEYWDRCVERTVKFIASGCDGNVYDNGKI